MSKMCGNAITCFFFTSSVATAAVDIDVERVAHGFQFAGHILESLQQNAAHAAVDMLECVCIALLGSMFIREWLSEADATFYLLHFHFSFPPLFLSFHP